MSHRQVVLVVVVLASLGLSARSQTTFTYLQGGNFEQVEFVDLLNGYISGDGGRIHYSEDGGLTWAEAETVNDDPEAWGNVHGMFFLGEWGEQDFKGWAACANGVVLRTTDIFGQEWEDANKLAFRRYSRGLGGDGEERGEVVGISTRTLAARA